jgi:hypothetical protein
MGPKKAHCKGIDRVGNLPTDRVSICIAFFPLVFMVADVRVYLDGIEVKDLMRIIIAFDKDYITLNLCI